jgi:phosphatidylglycerophosphate synthase
MLKQSEGLRGVQRSVGEAVAVIPITPNQWTALSIVLAVVAGVMVAQKNLGAGLALFAAAGFCDLIDGAVARARGQVTKLGGFIDCVADRFVEAIFLFSFMFYPLPQVLVDARVWLASLVFLGTCMPSFIMAYADHKEVVTKEKALAMGGTLERSERVILVLAGLAAGMLLSMEYFVYAIIASSLLSLVTIGQRLAEIMTHSQG